MPLHEARTLLRRAVPHLDPQLVSERALARIEEIPHLPPIAYLAGFECRLEAGDDRVDFELCVGRGPSLRGAVEAASDPRYLAGLSDAWRRIYRVLDAWSRPGSRLEGEIRVVWFELDARPGGALTPFPVFTLMRDPFHPDAVRDPEAIAALVDRVAGVMGTSIRTATRRMLRIVLDTLPKSSEVLHFALRPFPDEERVRLIVRQPWREIPSLLERAGWAGSCVELSEHLEALCRDAEGHSLNIDVGPELGPRIGVEVYFPSSPREDPRWQRCLDLLESVDACVPAKRAGLEAWGSTLEARRVENADDGDLIRDLVVKVVHEPSQRVRAKAYLPYYPYARRDQRTDSRPGMYNDT